MLQLDAKRSISKRDQQSQVFGSHAMVSPFIMFGDMSQLLLLGKVEYGGGPIFKVVLAC